MTKLITIIGHFGKGQVLLNGQTIKTKNLYETLIARYSNNNIGTVDTHKRLLFLCFSPFILLNVLHKSKNIIVLPAHNGVRTTIPLLVFLNKFFKRKIHYDVIGGWLPSLLEQNIRLLKTLSKLDYIYVETDTMLKRLNKLGLNNVQVLPNSRGYDVMSIPGIVVKNHGPFAWGKDAYQSVYHAVVLDKVAEMDIKTLVINRNAEMKQYVLDKHYSRKHGPNAYYGQKK
jgi:hypothetical protein